jgi:hypothetical protein
LSSPAAKSTTEPVYQQYASSSEDEGIVILGRDLYGLSMQPIPLRIIVPGTATSVSRRPHRIIGAPPDTICVTVASGTRETNEYIRQEENTGSQEGEDADVKKAPFFSQTAPVGGMFYDFLAAFKSFSSLSDPTHSLA